MWNGVDTEGALYELIWGVQECPARYDTGIVYQHGDLGMMTA